MVSTFTQEEKKRRLKECVVVQDVCKETWDRRTCLEKYLMVFLVLVSVAAAGLVSWLAVSYSHHEGCLEKPRYFGEVQLPGCPPIETRSQWGARPPKEAPEDLPAVPDYVFIQHGAGTQCFDKESCIRQVQRYQNLHMSLPRGWNDIGYNFVVGEDGNAYQGRGWDYVGAHTKGYNYNGIAICVIGDFTNHTPNALALSAVRQLIQCGLDNGKISSSYTLKGHRDVRDTASPGDAFYSLIQSWPHYAPSNDTWTLETTTASTGDVQ